MTLPPEIVDHIIDFIKDPWTLEACSRVARSWVARSRVHLFHQVVLFSHRRWHKVMSIGDVSPAKYIRTLTLAQGTTIRGMWINPDNLDLFLPHLKDFKNVENLALDWTPSAFSEDGLNKYFAHFGERLRSLELSGDRMSPDYFLALLGLLPNLEDLCLKQRVDGPVTDRVLAVPPKLSGRLTIRAHTMSIFPTLSVLPLRFREILLHDHRYEYQEAVDACAKTLVYFRAMSLDGGEWGSN